MFNKKHDISKQFAINVWDKMNIFLFTMSVVTTAIFVSLFVLCFIKQAGTDSHNMILGMCGVFASLASAFFIAWVVRYYDFLNKREQELKALELMRPYLFSIFTTMNSFFPQLRDFAKITDNDEISYPNGVIYYKKSNQKGRSFIDLNEAFKEAKTKLNSKITECLNAPMLSQCNIGVLELITELKLNRLTEKLFELHTYSSDALLKDSTHYGLFKNFEEFNSIYKTLASLTESNAVEKLEILSKEEQELYVNEINITKGLIKHPGIIYKGYDRIQ